MKPNPQIGYWFPISEAREIMRITSIAINTFRLLEDVSLCLEEGTTVIVGRNNSGKTSLTELFRCLLSESAIRFQLEDFSLGALGRFRAAYEALKKGKREDSIRSDLPEISVTLTVEYSADETLGPLAEFVIDLDETCTSALINIRYSLASGKISNLFGGLDDDDSAFFKALKERVPKYFTATIEAQDPNDKANRKVVDNASLRALLQFGFVNAQRTLDEAAVKGRGVLAKVFEKLFVAASSEVASTKDQEAAAALKEAAVNVQNLIDDNFNKQLTHLAPAFTLFGYPGLTDPDLRTETVLEVQQLFSNHTRVGYPGVNGVNLPESYNGLGPRNLIFILLKLYECFKEFANRQPASGVHLVFIEEPEAHLHPQMQTVFIRKLEELRKTFANQYNNGITWPVQFVVTTHSSHIANEASFDSMRYFLTRPSSTGSGLHSTQIKDLRLGLANEKKPNRDFLHEYMTLTRCDLLFADRAILIEGATERLLLPKMIEKLDDGLPLTASKLGSQHLSIVEVGGHHAHCFFGLLEFLDLRTLIVTDIDTTKKKTKDSKGKQKTVWVKCPVSEGERVSNSSINRWFGKASKQEEFCGHLLNATDSEKTKGNVRLAHQIPEENEGVCGRSFEGAFMLANADKFKIPSSSAAERELYVWEETKDVNKIGFALKYAILDSDWVTPRYIQQGLGWLAQDAGPVVKSDLTSGGEEEDSHA